MKVSIIIPTLNRDLYVLRTLNDLLKQNANFDFELIVVDQNQTPLEQRNDELSLISKSKNIKWIEYPYNGVVSARNKAINESKGEILIFVDDDVEIPDRNFLMKHVKIYDDSDDIAAVCGREINPNGNDFVKEINYERENPIMDIFYFPRNYFNRINAVVLSTANCSIRKNIIQKIGGFDESFSKASYGDDSDLALRLHGAGYKIIYDPSPTLVHLLAPKGGLRLSDRNNPHKESEKIISSLIFYFKHIHTSVR